jgi:hypothetical protein
MCPLFIITDVKLENKLFRGWTRPQRLHSLLD